MKVLTVTQGELIAIAVHYAVSIALEVVRPFLSRGNCSGYNCCQSIYIPLVLASCRNWLAVMQQFKLSLFIQ